MTDINLYLGELTSLSNYKYMYIKLFHLVYNSRVELHVNVVISLVSVD